MSRSCHGAGRRQLTRPGTAASRQRWTVPSGNRFVVGPSPMACACYPALRGVETGRGGSRAGHGHHHHSPRLAIGKRQQPYGHPALLSSNTIVTNGNWHADARSVMASAGIQSSSGQQDVELLGGGSWRRPDVPSAGTADGTRLQLWDCSSGDGRRWTCTSSRQPQWIPLPASSTSLRQQATDPNRRTDRQPQTDGSHAIRVGRGS